MSAPSYEYTVYRRIESGFTLIEISVVLIVTAILLASVYPTLQSQIENRQLVETRNKLLLIKEKLIAFAIQSPEHRLPCPDCTQAPCPGGTVLDGIEDMNGNICSAAAVYYGAVPWNTLGISPGDAWGRHFKYWVDVNYSSGSGFALGHFDGLAEMRRRASGGASTEIMADKLVVVLMSHGRNGYGAVDVETQSVIEAIPANGHEDEEENADLDFEFVSRVETQLDDTTDVGTFDDILVWISEYELKARMLNAGALP